MTESKLGKEYRGGQPATVINNANLAQRDDLLVRALGVRDVIELRHHVAVLPPLARQDLLPLPGQT